MPTMEPTERGGAGPGSAGDGVALLETSSLLAEKSANDDRPAAAAMDEKTGRKIAVRSEGGVLARTKTLLLSAAAVAAEAAEAGGLTVMRHTTVTTVAGAACNSRRDATGAEDTQVTGTPRLVAVTAEILASTDGLPAEAAASAGTEELNVSE